MADKMQPGRFTLRFNMNDPQQQAAVEILNRMGRQKAQFIAQALTHYAECKCHTQVENQPTWDEPALEQGRQDKKMVPLRDRMLRKSRPKNHLPSKTVP